MCPVRVVLRKLSCRFLYLGVAKSVVFLTGCVCLSECLCAYYLCAHLYLLNKWRCLFYLCGCGLRGLAVGCAALRRLTVSQQVPSLSLSARVQQFSLWLCMLCGTGSVRRHFFHAVLPVWTCTLRSWHSRHHG